MRYFVTGIDTEVGKTVVSAVLVQALTANYWKPIQSGDLEHSDSHKILDLISKKIMIYPESYRLTQPLSPHLSAKLDGIEIKLKDIIPPSSTNLIIEGAGGVMVPIDEKGTYVTDIIPFCDVEIILVTKNYLGSINHTLLSIQYLQSKNYTIKGIVVTGDENKETEAIITKNTGVPILFHVPMTDNLSKQFIKEQASKIRTLIQ
ncbi:MAG: dethiobiotin synthase [Flavobacteriales bacterium]|jgi:dethiobiotin synthetase|nr:dethiobiotin synthase [Flavobacteriales bacterium]